MRRDLINSTEQFDAASNLLALLHILALRSAKSAGIDCENDYGNWAECDECHYARMDCQCHSYRDYDYDYEPSTSISADNENKGADGSSTTTGET